MIYQFRIPPYRVVFDTQFVDQWHHVRMRRWHDDGANMARYNSRNECRAHFHGLFELWRGQPHIRLPIDHHVFEFGRCIDGDVSIRCLTPNHPDDYFVIPGAELTEMITGYSLSLQWYDERERALFYK